MANIVCLTSGLTGIVNSSFELVRRLQAANHTVMYCSPSDIKDQVERQGLDLIQLPPVNFSPAPTMPKMQGGLVNRMKIVIERIRLSQKHRNKGMQNLDLEYFASLLREQHVDLAIIDLECPDHIVEALINDVKVIVLSQFFSLSRRVDIPPLTSSVIPGYGLENVFQIHWEWWKYAFKAWFETNKNKLASLRTDRRSILIGYAKAKGLDLRPFLYNTSYWPGPFLYKRLRTLNMVSRNYDFPGKLRKDEYNVGPMVFSDRKEEIGKESEQKIESIIDKENSPDSKIIFCSLSTMTSAGVELLNLIAKLAETHPEWRFVCGLGKMNEVSLKTIPSNLVVLPMVPSLSVLPHSDCAIVTAGINTINECIWYGVPMLAYSLGIYDQNGNAARVAFHKIGQRGDVSTGKLADMEMGINEILSNHQYKQNVMRLSHQCRSEAEYRLLEKVVKEELERKNVAK